MRRKMMMMGSRVQMTMDVLKANAAAEESGWIYPVEEGIA